MAEGFPNNHQDNSGDGLETDTVTVGINEFVLQNEEQSSSPRRELTTEEQALIEALPDNAAVLISRTGSNSGARFLLDSGVTSAGRHPDSDIFLDDVTVSRRHLTFLRDESGFFVVDVGSLNGTYVDGEKVEKAPLHSGSEIKIGKFQLTFFTPDRAKLASSGGAAESESGRGE